MIKLRTISWMVAVAILGGVPADVEAKCAVREGKVPGIVCSDNPYQGDVNVECRKAHFKAANELSEYPEKYCDLITSCEARIGYVHHIATKACVDEDIISFEELASYPGTAVPFLETCLFMDRDEGMAAVKDCVDREIESKNKQERPKTIRNLLGYNQ